MDHTYDYEVYDLAPGWGKAMATDRIKCLAHSPRNVSFLVSRVCRFPGQNIKMLLLAVSLAGLASVSRCSKKRVR